MIDHVCIVCCIHVHTVIYFNGHRPNPFVVPSGAVMRVLVVFFLRTYLPACVRACVRGVACVLLFVLLSLSLPPSLFVSLSAGRDGSRCAGCVCRCLGSARLGGDAMRCDSPTAPIAHGWTLRRLKSIPSARLMAVLTTVSEREADAGLTVRFVLSGSPSVCGLACRSVRAVGQAGAPDAPRMEQRLHATRHCDAPAPPHNTCKPHTIDTSTIDEQLHTPSIAQRHTAQPHDDDTDAHGGAHEPMLMHIIVIPLSVTQSLEHECRPRLTHSANSPIQSTAESGSLS